VSLTPGQLICTTLSTRWQSTKYWDCNNLEWIHLPIGTVCLVVEVSTQDVKFIARDRQYIIQNCYYDELGNPIWCNIL